MNSPSQLGEFDHTNSNQPSFMPQNRPDSSPLPGSERKLPPDAQLIGPCSPATLITVTLYLRARNQDELQRRLQQLPQTQSSEHLTPTQFAERYGADPADLDRVNSFAKQNGLHVVEADLGRRSVQLSGSISAMESAFGIQLHDYHHKGSTYRLRQGSVYLPANLQGVVTGVFGLDNRPQAAAHFRLRPTAAAASPQSFNPTDLAHLYSFPTSATGQGETIGIIELGGGYQQSDLTTYFQQLGVNPAPQVTAVPVDGGQNSPTGDANSADGEVELDIEVAGAIAPGANQKIFFAPNTDQGFIDALTSAVHDADVTLISISWVRQNPISPPNLSPPSTRRFKKPARWEKPCLSPPEITDRPMVRLTVRTTLTSRRLVRSRSRAEARLSKRPPVILRSLRRRFGTKKLKARVRQEAGSAITSKNRTIRVKRTYLQRKPKAAAAVSRMLLVTRTR